MLANANNITKTAGENGNKVPGMMSAEIYRQFMEANNAPSQEGDGNKGMGVDMTVWLERAEVGDAELFALHFKDKFVYDRSSKTWYVWKGHYWEEDKLGEVRRSIPQP